MSRPPVMAVATGVTGVLSSTAPTVSETVALAPATPVLPSDSDTSVHWAPLSGPFRAASERDASVVEPAFNVSGIAEMPAEDRTVMGWTTCAATVRTTQLSGSPPTAVTMSVATRPVAAGAPTFAKSTKRANAERPIRPVALALSA